MRSSPRLLLAHAASAASDGRDPLISGLTGHWRPLGLAVHTLALPSGTSDAGDADNIRRFDAAARAMPGDGPLLLGGFSLGARMAALAAPSLDPAALVLFGYPFHVHGAPQTQHGLAALQAVTAPVQIVQGARDAHGNQQEARGYNLPANVDVHWIPGARHRFGGEHLEQAGTVAAAFVERVLSGGRHD